MALPWKFITQFLRVGAQFPILINCTHPGAFPFIYIGVILRNFRVESEAERNEDELEHDGLQNVTG